MCNACVIHPCCSVCLATTYIYHISIYLSIYHNVTAENSLVSCMCACPDHWRGTLYWSWSIQEFLSQKGRFYPSQRTMVLTWHVSSSIIFQTSSLAVGVGIFFLSIYTFISSRFVSMVAYDRTGPASVVVATMVLLLSSSCICTFIFFFFSLRS